MATETKLVLSIFTVNALDKMSMIDLAKSISNYDCRNFLKKGISKWHKQDKLKKNGIPKTHDKNINVYFNLSCMFAFEAVQYFLIDRMCVICVCLSFVGLTTT